MLVLEKLKNIKRWRIKKLSDYVDFEETFNYFTEKVDEFIDVASEKIDDFFDNVYQKIPGSIFGFTGVAISAFSTLTSLLLYMAVDPSFSFVTHWISNLGGGPNGSSFVFNSGMMVTSIFILLFQIYVIRDLKKRGGNKILIKLLFLAAICSTAGLFFVGVFPLTVAILHGTAASFYFFGGLIFCTLYGVLVLLTPGVHKIQAILGFITAGFFGLHLFTSMITALFTEVEMGINMFTEWSSLFAVLILILESAFYSVKVKISIRRKARKNQIEGPRLSQNNITKLRNFIQSIKKQKIQK